MVKGMLRYFWRVQMKTIKRIIENLKWLFNYPPTSIDSNPDDIRKLACDYCGTTANFFSYLSKVTICADCRKKVYDHVLRKQDESSGS